MNRYICFLGPDDEQVASSEVHLNLASVAFPRRWPAHSRGPRGLQGYHDPKA